MMKRPQALQYNCLNRFVIGNAVKQPEEQQMSESEGEFEQRCETGQTLAPILIPNQIR